MAQIPIDEKHKAQILAGTSGRDEGHKFEKQITDAINKMALSEIIEIDASIVDSHIFNGNPAILLLQYIFKHKQINPKQITHLHAFWLGGLATSGNGDEILDENGNKICKAKSDILITLKLNSKEETINVGVSVKKCNNKNPTNAQLYFTTAHGFCNKLLRANGILISKEAEEAMKMFCGDEGYRPKDHDPNILVERKSDHDRYFWEELNEKGRLELEELFTKEQDRITDLLLRKAYENDPFPPEFLIHQTRKYSSMENVEVAIYSIDQLITLSKKYKSFEFKNYMVKKGTYKGDPNTHKAPRFGVIQMQRGGQKQHPTQLQFNLKCGYFYHLNELI